MRCPVDRIASRIEPEAIHECLGRYVAIGPVVRRLSGRSHEPSADRMTDRSCSNAGQNDLHSHQPREKKPAEEIIWPTNRADREVVQETRSWNDQHPKSAEVAHGVKPQRGPAHHLLDKHRCAAFSRTSWSVVDLYGIKPEGLLHSDRITADQSRRASGAILRRRSSIASSEPSFPKLPMPNAPNRPRASVRFHSSSRSNVACAGARSVASFCGRHFPDACVAMSCFDTGHSSAHPTRQWRRSRRCGSRILFAPEAYLTTSDPCRSRPSEVDWDQRKTRSNHLLANESPK